MPAGNAYPSGHLVPSPILGLADAPIVETKFLELAMSLLDFSPRIPLGTFSILLCMGNKNVKGQDYDNVLLGRSGHACISVMYMYVNYEYSLTNNFKARKKKCKIMRVKLF